MFVIVFSFIKNVPSLILSKRFILTCLNILRKQENYSENNCKLLKIFRKYFIKEKIYSHETWAMN